MDGEVNAQNNSTVQIPSVPAVPVPPSIPVIPQVPPVPVVQVEEPKKNAGILDLIEKALEEKETRDTNKKKPKPTTIVNEDGTIRQPRRSKRLVTDDRLYDGTQLRAEHHGYFVHRDYGAHFFRWGFVTKLVAPGMRILDVGCGQDLAFERVLSAPNVFMNCKPEKVVAVDWNTINTGFNPAWLQKHEEYDFCTRWPELIGSFSPVNGQWREIQGNRFDIIICLEVIEHMNEESGDKLLEGIWRCMKDNGVAVISTPVFNGYAAANHIREYTIPEMAEKLERAGFTIEKRYGTFASMPDLKKAWSAEEQAICQRLSEYYGNDVISCFLAPLYPDQARNNVWICRKDPQVIRETTSVTDWDNDTVEELEESEEGQVIKTLLAQPVELKEGEEYTIFVDLSKVQDNIYKD